MEKVRASNPKWMKEWDQIYHLASLIREGKAKIVVKKGKRYTEIKVKKSGRNSYGDNRACM